MSTNERPPLWQEMNTAQMALGYPLPQEMAYSDAISAMHMIRAAEIRAVADATPEEFYGANGVKAWLLNEAKRAEAGE